MIPGVLGGQYTPAQATVRLDLLSRGLGISFIHATGVSVDPHRRTLRLQLPLEVEGGSTTTTLPFDVLCVDVGSSTRGVPLCGQGEEETGDPPTPGGGGIVYSRPVHHLLAQVEQVETHGADRLQEVGPSQTSVFFLNNFTLFAFSALIPCSHTVVMRVDPCVLHRRHPSTLKFGVVVVGGGAAGFELLCALQDRLENPTISFTLIDSRASFQEHFGCW